MEQNPNIQSELERGGRRCMFLGCDKPLLKCPCQKVKSCGSDCCSYNFLSALDRYISGSADWIAGHKRTALVKNQLLGCVASNIHIVWLTVLKTSNASSVEDTAVESLRSPQACYRTRDGGREDPPDVIELVGSPMTQVRTRTEGTKI